MGKNEVDRGKIISNETNLSNLSISKTFNKAGVLIFKGAKRGGVNLTNSNGNTKKGVKAARGFDYLTSGAKKAFNFLWHMFT